MGSTMADKPHALCLPFPGQGHINPMMKLAMLLHSRGFHITFVNTHFTHERIAESCGPSALTGLHDFRLETISDGLPQDHGRILKLPELCEAALKNFPAPLKQLIVEINESGDVPPVSCIVSSGFLNFTQEIADEVGVPRVALWTTSACGYWGYFHVPDLIQKGYTPLKDEKCLSNGYLNTRLDWVPEMPDICLKDMPSFIRTTDPNEYMLHFTKDEAQKAFKSSALILNTFDEFETEILDAMKAKLPCPIYTMGPLLTFASHACKDQVNQIPTNLWKEDSYCLEWLDNKEIGSVIYVNFGSIAVLTTHQLNEFAWGLAKSQKPFIWIIRKDLVMGESAILSQEFTNEIKERGLITGWCNQAQVLSHPSVGGFLTHAGWNSTLESICNGVPMICWPFFAEQPMNCRYACSKWGIGMEISSGLKREEVEGLVRELMEGEKGRELRSRVKIWKETSKAAIKFGGSSYCNLDRLIKEVLMKQQ
ncbi:hypothetical protein AMTRI_Chr04g182400 [Amborella trichopoda]